MWNFEFRVLCQPGAAVNEDAVFTGPDWILVLDGSSALHKRQTTSGPSDAAWFVENIGRSFAGEIDREPRASLPTLLERAVLITQERYEAGTAGAQVDRLDQPSASVIAARLAGGRLDYFVLGDGGLVAKSNGTVHVLQDDRIAAFDAVALADLRSALREKSFEAALAEIQPTLSRNRAMKNIPGGYGVLAPSEACLAMARTGALLLGDTGTMIAFTDGFAALVNAFKAVADYPALLDLVSEAGLPHAEKNLLRLTQADPDCRNFPRFKRLDDYTCVHARW